jgi:hypothetical protein
VCCNLVAMQLLEIYRTIIAWSQCNCFEYTVLLLLGRAPIWYVISWSRCNCSEYIVLLLLGRGSNASNILYYYWLVALRLWYVIAWSRCNCSEYIILSLLDRGATASNLLYYYCLIALRLWYVITWSRCNCYDILSSTVLTITSIRSLNRRRENILVRSRRKTSE